MCWKNPGSIDWRITVDITLQYFDDCPNWKVTNQHLENLIDELSLHTEVRYQRIETPEDAADQNFHGSPTVLINGIDPFAENDAPVGLSCRIYRTDEGLAGTPTIDQLRQALTGG